jgi:hypothetical protein
MRRKKINPGQSIKERPTPADIVRFLGFVQVEHLLPLNHVVRGPCWSWTGAGDDKGYGWFWFSGKRRWAHRVSVAFFKRGGIPDGYEVNHDCCNHRCVNPDHLQPLSKSANSVLKPWHTPPPQRTADDDAEYLPESELPDPSQITSASAGGEELPI